MERNKGNRTFCTKDFSHKSFSTSFGPFAQFLVVISHNNYNWETSIWKVYWLILIRHFTFTRSNGENIDIYYVITSTRSKCSWTQSLFLLEERRGTNLSLYENCKELLIWKTTSITFPLLNKKPFSFDCIIHYKHANMTTHAKDTMLISKVTVTSLPSLFNRLQTAFLSICKSFK